jgi:hypothetical protein
MVNEIWERIISTEIEHQKMQAAYFAARTKAGPVVRPRVYQPKKEPDGGHLVAIFVEPGATHLVFRDEIAPSAELDEQYREVRKKVFGRTHDVESVEYIEGDIDFHNNYAGMNVYETSFHWSAREPDKGSVFSETWNHMLTAGGKWINVLRGGYVLVEVPILEGDRAVAEAWKPEVEA